MIHVTCAILIQNGNILCAQRSEKMRHPLKWEFPGGKVEEGESMEFCLKREIEEELNIQVKVGISLTFVQHSYNGGKEIILHPFLFEYIPGDLQPKEHKELRWLPSQKLIELDWVEADLPIVEEVLRLFKKLN